MGTSRVRVGPSLSRFFGPSRDEPGRDSRWGVGDSSALLHNLNPSMLIVVNTLCFEQYYAVFLTDIVASVTVPKSPMEKLFMPDYKCMIFLLLTTLVFWPHPWTRLLVKKGRDRH